MTQISHPNLLDAVGSRVQSVLNEAGVYDIDTIGWLNAYDPDPKWIGHAMWQLDGPRLNLHELLGEQSVTQRPSEIEKQIATLGEDFSGTMRFSRLSTGLALLWQTQAREDPMNESPFFWLHYTDAVLKLAIASDRLRDLLIAACTGTPPKEYGKGGKRHRLYVAPFQDAEQLLATRGLQDIRIYEAAKSLPALGASIFRFVSRRNAIVHEVATFMAKLTWQNFAEMQERYDREKRYGFSPPLEAPEQCSTIVALRDPDEDEHGIESAMGEVQSWYQLLLEASHCVFQVEYWSRRLA